ncbi:MAG TPA: ABC transporter permease [Vicinamibacteria bacterium]
MSLRRVWIRLLLKLYPSSFRKKHGDELLEMYSRLDTGLLGSTSDLVENAVHVWLEHAVEGRGGGAPRRKSAFLDGLSRDVTSSLRALRNRPLFSAVFLAVLALGVGANTAIFSVVNWVVLRPLAFTEPDRVVRVYWTPDSFNQRILEFFRERGSSFSGLSGFSGWAFTLVGEGEPEELSGAVVSTNLFEVLGVGPLLGRTFAFDEGEPGRGEVCILSEGLWRRRFGADRGTLGRRIQLAGAGRTSCTVVGIVTDAQSTIDAFGPREAFLPLERPADLEQDNSWFLSVVGRLKPGVSAEAASAEAKELSRLVRETMYPRTAEEKILHARVERLQDAIVGRDVRGQLGVLSFSIALVLVSACLNLSSLLLARFGEREQEMAVRSALGAGRGRVVRQLLAESLVLGLAGGALGAALAVGSTRFLTSLLPPELPRIEGLAIDGSVLLFAFALSVAAALAFGLLPSLRASAKLDMLLIRGGASTGAPSLQRLNRGLVAFEIASSVILLTAASLSVESFLRLSGTDPGFDAERALVAAVTVPDGAHDDAEQKRQLFRSLEAKLSAIPGVEEVGAIHILPLDSSNWNFPFYPEGTDYGPNETPPRANFRVVSPGYFRAMGIPLLEGRELADADREGSAPVGMVNESFARAFFPGESAVGKTIRLFNPDGEPFEIVGISGDVRQHGLAVPPSPEMYRPFEQWSVGRYEILLRTWLPPASLNAAVRRAVATVDPNLPIVRLSPMSGIVAASLAASRFVALLLGAFAALALFLAVVGVFGIAASIAGARKREIGIRMALGSSSTSVVRRMMASGMAPVLPGLLAGLVGSQAVSRLLLSYVPNLRPPSFAALAATSGFLAAAALLAAYLPARKSSRLDPVAVLRLD